MLQLVVDGPEIPFEVLKAQEEDRLLLFCGAGISVYTGLPSFEGLCEYVMDAMHLTPEHPTQAAFKKHQYDHYLGLIESSTVAGVMRKHVTERLMEKYEKDLVVHKAILDLARCKNNRIRLVTTNFDQRFIQAGLDPIHIDCAPRLPVPKSNVWYSTVFLHGLIDHDRDPEGNQLVLTTADFGRAYLTDGWASRFLTELFREFTVLFVGYGVTDPVVSYLVSALAASTQFKHAYALAGHRSDEKLDSARWEWRARNVEPILYDKRDGHKLLNETLFQWAKMKRSTASYRKEIIAKSVSEKPNDADQTEKPSGGNKIEKPSGGNNMYARQLCWALFDSDGNSARYFANQENCPDFKWWLEVFDQFQWDLGFGTTKCHRRHKSAAM